MSLYQNSIKRLKQALISRLSNVDIAMAARERFGNKASEGIVPLFIPQRRVTLEEWQQAIDQAQNPLSLNRWQYYRIEYAKTPCWIFTLQV
jgi:hypothetical protein